eukprot:CAMPEP_0175663172 /NCGR_PEP_ID=MMETSP0097-20121207/15860_1 /TAXON_ID=311494 /ORGANISM="Alexandrium monilatum, Strain CCMP3105" /LENGTH=74 /DNA_ID=CAMNT_0016969413 /DNA_START=76 /DNA_END=296 /DNA_ORIENTATION=+
MGGRHAGGLQAGRTPPDASVPAGTAPRHARMAVRVDFGEARPAARRDASHGLQEGMNPLGVREELLRIGGRDPV